MRCEAADDLPRGRHARLALARLLTGLRCLAAWDGGANPWGPTGRGPTPFHACNANTQNAMKIQAAPVDTDIVRASPACAREGIIRALYLPRDAKTRINRFAHQEAERHAANVKDRIIGSLQTLADNGATLQGLLAALPALLGEPTELISNAPAEMAANQIN
jgi:hypothetical protein